MKGENDVVKKGTFVVGDCTMGDDRPPWKRRADGNAEMMRDSEPALMLKMGMQEVKVGRKMRRQ